ncbi:single-stranded DNA-binding protein [Microbacterium sp. gxy059]|uniref:single-stranded DNA-binding protein n=1 Tax=Microbacterium sp. gxy059 TaxID=2957199 RepID=UPI003D991C6C
MTATITIHGGLTAAPELRYTQAGKPVCSGSVASTDRYRDRQTGEWKDGKKLYLRWTAWDQIAENIAASGLDKGAQVAITGKLHTREYEDREGVRRTSTELEVTDFAVSLRRATAQVARNAPRDASGGAHAPSQGFQATPPAEAPQTPVQDSWSSTAPDSWGVPNDGEAPF